VDEHHPVIRASSSDHFLEIGLDVLCTAANLSGLCQPVPQLRGRSVLVDRDLRSVEARELEPELLMVRPPLIEQQADSYLFAKPQRLRVVGSPMDAGEIATQADVACGVAEEVVG
jgi:hypothetical protein